MRHRDEITLIAALSLVCVCARSTLAQAPSLVPEPVYNAIADEASGETALRHLEVITQRHRMRGSREFHAAAQHVADALTKAGLSGVEILRLPADGARTVADIRDALTLEYGPVPADQVLEYLSALEEIGVVKRVEP